MTRPALTRPGRRTVVALLCTLVLVAPLVVLWQASRVPSVSSVMDMGYLDLGGGPAPAGAHGHGAGPASMPGTRSVSDLVADPARRPDVTVELVTRQEQVTVAGRTFAGYTVNGQTPGPVIRAVQGQLVQVHLTNASVAAGVSLHWHGLDVPNAMDGVAGVTQDAVPVGGSFTYRFVAEQSGTFWYHSHQVSDAQVVGGLFGAVVVTPKAVTPNAKGGVRNVVATTHTYGGVRTINGASGDSRVEAAPGERVRVRVVNTDNGSVDAWASAPFRLVAVDGTEVHRPTPVSGQRAVVTAGGRADLEVTLPSDGAAVRVQIGSGSALVIGRRGNVPAPPPQPTRTLDLLGYGSPAPLGFDPGHPNRVFTYSIGRRPGFVRGVPGLWWSINGHLYPNVPMFVVRSRDVVVMHIRNHSGQVHPMHLHGHHAVVLSRNGVASTGSPWWVDSLNVLDGESYDIAFVADNPGIWMDHCHDLRHAAQGMVAHLMYEGVTEPYRLGGAGRVANTPE